MRCEYGPKYEGYLFKVKLQHFETRRDNRLSQLINRYLVFDKDRIMKIAVVWIVLLKINRLVGKKYGYPSSNTYLLMLINYF